jgi:uncharacterized protein YbbK (DUF523 family)
MLLGVYILFVALSIGFDSATLSICEFACGFMVARNTAEIVSGEDREGKVK